MALAVGDFTPIEYGEVEPTLSPTPSSPIPGSAYNGPARHFLPVCGSADPEFQYYTFPSTIGRWPRWRFAFEMPTSTPSSIQNTQMTSQTSKMQQIQLLINYQQLKQYPATDNLTVVQMMNTLYLCLVNTCSIAVAPTLASVLLVSLPGLRV